MHQTTFNIPKIELHAHIGGCMRPATFMELAMAKGADLDAVDFYNVNIGTAFEFFRINSQLVTDLATLQRVTYEIIEDYEKQNTRYLELRSSPKAYGEKTKADCLNALLEVFEQAEKDMPNLKVRLLVSINRQSSLESAQETLELVKETDSRFIVGVELSGDPREGSFTTFEDELRRFREETGKKISLHCAEVEEQKGETRAMIDFAPERLGHCIYMVSVSCFLLSHPNQSLDCFFIHQTEEEMQEVVDKNIPIEVCPTSNLAAYKEAHGATKELP